MCFKIKSKNTCIHVHVYNTCLNTPLQFLIIYITNKIYRELSCSYLKSKCDEDSWQSEPQDFHVLIFVYISETCQIFREITVLLSYLYSESGEEYSQPALDL